MKFNIQPLSFTLLSKLHILGCFKSNEVRLSIISLEIFKVRTMKSSALYMLECIAFGRCATSHSEIGDAETSERDWFHIISILPYLVLVRSLDLQS